MTEVQNLPRPTLVGAWMAIVGVVMLFIGYYGWASGFDLGLQWLVGGIGAVFLLLGIVEMRISTEASLR